MSISTNFMEEGLMKEVKLTNSDLVALVDDEDYEYTLGYKWHLSRSKNSKTYYAFTHVRDEKEKRLTLSLHRFIMCAAKGVEIDHKDLDGLNNQRSNLRVATRPQQSYNRDKLSNNSVGYKGVSVNGNKFSARIRANGVSKYLGVFNTALDAHEAYKAAAKELHKEFARY